MRKSNQKLKILYLQKMLLEETDDTHGLSTNDIIERLAQYDIPAERKSIYRDLESLREFGLDIIKRSNEVTGTAEYAIGERDFEMPELLLMVDAIQNSRFLTERKSAALVKQISKLASHHQAESLAGRVHVHGRIKMQNESIFYTVNEIQEALTQRYRISFHYLKYDINKKSIMRKDGKFYQENPLSLVYRNDFYYLITYNDDHESFLTYRVDRMRDIKMLNEPTTRNQRIATFDVGEYVSRTFSMYDGQHRHIELLIEADLVGSFIDRFGKDIELLQAEDGHARIYVDIMEGATFYGWLAQFGTKARIEKPSEVAENYRQFLEDIVKQYK